MFTHLHVHSEYSALDGLSTPKELAKLAAADGQTALAITDHGICAAHPDFQLACQAEGIKPIFGLEAYFVDDRFERKEGGKKPSDYWHLILLAMDDEGLRNLWSMSTESYRDGLWSKYARLDWDTLQRLNKGVIATTACLGGPVLKPLNRGDEELATSNLLRLHEIFGDRLYLEIQPGSAPEQVSGNQWLLDAADAYGIEPILACDSHYPTPDDKHSHKVWVASAIGKTLDELADSTMFEGDEDYHLMTEAEARASVAYLGAHVDRLVANTMAVADRCTAEITLASHNPVYSRKTAESPDPAQQDITRLLEDCLTRWDERTLGKRRDADAYMARFETEFGLIAEKGFAGYFLMVADLVGYAKQTGILVGPGRGSGGGSLVAYLLGITEIDPVEHDVLFERFMTRGRTELPDFDIDFPSSKKAEMYGYVARRWGADNVATVGTHMRLKSKSAIQAVARALKSQLPEDHWIDIQACSAIIEAAEGDTAGLGLSWEDLWDRAGELLQTYADKYPQVFELAEQFHGRLKSYGKHPAGVIIDPDAPLTENLPLRMGEDGQMIAQFDLKVLEMLGYVKFDLLNISNLDMLQKAMDLIRERTGKVINPYAWVDELEDPYLYEQIGEGHTLGLFQIGSAIGTAMSRRMKPRDLHELADLVTLVRPGPSRSGLTDLYLARRKGELEVSYADPRMEDVLAKTWGAMIYQEQLMKLCMVLAGYDDVQADKVRKVLGKKKVEEAKKLGVDFIERAMGNGTTEHVTRDLWEQMEEFARYSFGYAHALAYAILGVWTAWFKFHYPLYFLCAALSIVDADKYPAFIEEARRMGYRVLPPDINLSGRGFGLGDTGLDIRFGIDSIKGVGPAAVESILAAQPYASWEDFRERSGANSGVVKTLVRIGALDSLVPNRRYLERVLEHAAIKDAEKCVHRGPATADVVWLPTPKRGAPQEPEKIGWAIPCTYDWLAEPDEVNESTGKKVRRKPPPKLCSKACRRWQAITVDDAVGTVAPYTDKQIRDIEQDMLGIYLSSTPFDAIPAEDLAEFATAEDVESGPNGTYMVAAILQEHYFAKNRTDMGFVKLTTPRGTVSAVCFPDEWEQFSPQFRKGGLVYTSMLKTDRGQTLKVYLPIDDTE